VIATATADGSTTASAVTEKDAPRRDIATPALGFSGGCRGSLIPANQAKIDGAESRTPMGVSLPVIGAQTARGRNGRFGRPALGAACESRRSRPARPCRRRSITSRHASDEGDGGRRRFPKLGAGRY